MAESHARSIAKAVSWRITGSLDTILVSLLITGHIKTAVSIGLVEVLTKTCIYYFHERIWNRVRFGRVQCSDYEI